ncbi:apelin receptor A [Latimeria chalumnae]|uniref:apelin receptor A n=1 Tax=Latimeria chalumnae TaxID=7897 RepID=UPI0003C1492A|nr:PREDICTED: apelin receptor [Latimeria chalumnae]|eukprot:XP_005999317.1 PREDICTED: apelin receptor [Latimeria chalumnae]
MTPYLEKDNFSDGSNDSQIPCPFDEWEPSFALIPIIYFLIFILGLSGNGMVIWMVFHMKEKRRSADTFIANLALADLTFVVSLPLWAVYTAQRYHWVFGTFLCKLSSYLIYINMYASVFCLTCLSFDRYLAIVRSMARSHLRSKTSSFMAIIVVWVLAAILALPALVFRSTSGHEAPNSCFMDFSFAVEEEEEEIFWTAGLGISYTVLGFVLPFCIMTTCYFAIGRTVAQHFQKHKEDLRKRRLLTIIATLVATFAACWLPFHLVSTMYNLMYLDVIPFSCGLERFLMIVYPYATCLAYINSCVNPFLYAFFDLRFRAQCLDILSCGRLWSALQDKMMNFSSSNSQNSKCDPQTLPSKV